MISQTATDYLSEIRTQAIQLDSPFELITGGAENEFALLELLDAGLIIQVSDVCVETSTYRKFELPAPPSFKNHNGYITVENPKTGDHRTFRVKLETWNEGEPNEVTNRVVSLLTGPDRTRARDWTKFAFVKDGEVKVWNKFKLEIALKPSPFPSYAKILNDPERGEELGLRYMLEGRCRACDRALTNPESIRSGIGPVCGRRENAA
jgi:Family of unknown function (DUF6011)